MGQDGMQIIAKVDETVIMKLPVSLKVFLTRRWFPHFFHFHASDDAELAENWSKTCHLSSKWPEIWHASTQRSSYSVSTL